MEIKFFSQLPVHLKERKRLKQFLKDLMINEGVTCTSLHFIFCDDEYLLEINRRFLDHDFYTDIISFNLAVAGAPLEAEFYISVPRVRENARKHQFTFHLELLRVIIHGVLHFAGFDDKTPYAKKKMTKREDYYLNLFHVSRGTT